VYKIRLYITLRLLLLIGLFESVVPVFSQFYNGSQLTFGKNRVQFNDRYWTFYKFNKFDTYFYLNGKGLAIFTAKFAEDNIAALEKKFDYVIESRIQFVIFNRLSDLKESNIGLVSDEQYNVGGITHIVGSKVFLYYDGNHENFERQIKAGIAQVVMNEMIFGQQITAKIKNSTLLSLPDWYVQGLVSYMSDSWNIDLDNYVKDGVLSGRYEKFNRLTGTDAVYAGHSIWKYIAEKYGEDKIPNILYMTKISKSVESGFLYVLGVSFKTFTREWLDYYDKKYYQFDKQLSMPTGEPLVKNKRSKKVFQQLKMSADGSYSAFVTNDLGKYKVWLYNSEKKKSKKLMRVGHKLDEKTDYSIPVLAWHPSSKRLAIITEKKGKLLLYFYNLDEKKFEKQRLFDFQKILSFSYSQNGKLLAMSGVMNGQTDIFVYSLSAHTYEQITKDIYDDFDPVFINNSNKIIFSSNRVSDTIRTASKDSILVPTSKQDLFLYNYENKDKTLRRLTNSELTNETKPLVINDNYISYLSDKNGIVNRYTAKLDSAINFVDTTTHYRYFMTSYPQTNYSRNILDYNICPDKSTLGEIIYDNGKYQVYTGELASTDNLTKLELKNTPYIDEVLKQKEKQRERAIEKEKNAKQAKKATVTASKQVSSSPVSPDTTTQIKHKKLTSVHVSDTVQAKNKIDINNYSFNNENANIKKDKTNQKDVLLTKPDSTKNKINQNDFVLPKQRNYDVEYSIDQLVSQVDFSFLNNAYQPFTNSNSPIYINSGFNALFKVGVTDLLEDYRITGGVRLSVDLDNTEYLLSFENLKKRLDKQVLFDRQTLENITNSSVTKDITNEVLYILKWPFSEVIGLKGTALVRNDRTVDKSIDYPSLTTPDVYKTWAGLKGELTFDNTRDQGLNLYYGTRWKLFAETYRQLDVKNEQLNVVGFDIRNYQKISRTFIWANRFAASTSFGTQKLIYYMGGVDNWLFPKFDTTTNVAKNQNYAYQTLATDMRGFRQNVRNGNSFALISSELRFPIFHYLINRPLKSDFFNNFQIIGFGDMGTAWTGSNPYSDKNALYTETYHQGPITVTVKTQQDPIVFGYGFGLRSRLLGYFIRADWAWGVENGIVQPRVFYLSLGLDY